MSRTWAKYLLRRSYEIFDPLAKKLRVPTYVFLALVAASVLGILALIGNMVGQPSATLVDTIPSIHLEMMNASQVGEMDITAYLEIQGKLQALGFTPVLQMTVPQLPSPNFFDAGIRSDADCYSEILKVPGQQTPRLSFLTVFTNGVWYSTNGWEGTSRETDDTISEFFPADTAEQLFNRHVQTVGKLKDDREWQVQPLSQNRYMAAFSDHVRGYLVQKKVPIYKADLASWH